MSWTFSPQNLSTTTIIDELFNVCQNQWGIYQWLIPTDSFVLHLKPSHCFDVQIKHVPKYVVEIHRKILMKKSLGDFVEISGEMWKEPPKHELWVMVLYFSHEMCWVQDDGSDGESFARK